jgi:mannose-6-phosphate isomerase
MALQPMKMQPALVERIWGGRRLADLFGKALPPGARIGESWELSDHPHGRSRVAEGPMAGLTLREVLDRSGPAVVGRGAAARGWAARFGLLIKFIDATDRLSVQVHPDDAYAAAHSSGESGKTECWTIVDAEPEAWIIHGLKAGTTREQFAEALKQGGLEDVLAVRPVKVGDFIWVPAGTVHAVGPGIVLAEVQQTSDLTYRVYDWNRVDERGKPRELHARQAMEAIHFTDERPPAGGRARTANETGLVIDHLVDCPAFSLSRIQLDRRPWSAETRGAFVAVVVLAGSAQLATAEGVLAVRAGDTVLVPADAGEYVFERAEKLTALVAAPPGGAPRQ